MILGYLLDYFSYDQECNWFILIIGKVCLFMSDDVYQIKLTTKNFYDI